LEWWVEFRPAAALASVRLEELSCWPLDLADARSKQAAAMRMKIGVAADLRIIMNIFCTEREKEAGQW
jgi:hypothetical protein